MPLLSQLFPTDLSPTNTSATQILPIIYLTELLDTSENAHHAFNLLLQAPGPVLHPVCKEDS